MSSKILKLVLVLIAIISTFAFHPMSSKTITEFDVYMTILILSVFSISFCMINKRDKRK